MALPDGPNQPATRQLTAAIASGSTEAFAAFYESWFDRCVESTMTMTRFDEATALDIVQDAMMTVATQMPRFDEERQLRAWLDRVLLNAARDRIRSETRRRTPRTAAGAHRTRADASRTARGTRSTPRSARRTPAIDPASALQPGLEPQEDRQHAGAWRGGIDRRTHSKSARATSHRVPGPGGRR